MILDNNKIMLIFGMNDEEKEILDKIIYDFALPGYKDINESMGKMTMEDILKGIKIELFNISLPKEKTIIFNNFSDDEINVAINEIKRKFKPLPILAAITPNSIKWTFEKLLQHLIEERNWYNSRK